MESGRRKLIEEKTNDQPKLSSNLIKELFEKFDGDFLSYYFLPGGLTKNKDTLFTPVNIVALYMAFIHNHTERKKLAPYFLNALNQCTALEIGTLVQGTRPVDSETYRAIEKMGKTSKSIEAYICYVLVTADINQLKIEELNGALNYLQEHHADKANVLNSLKATLTALALARENKVADFRYRDRGQIDWPPKDINASNLCRVVLPLSVFIAPPYQSEERYPGEDSTYSPVITSFFNNFFPETSFQSRSDPDLPIKFYVSPTLHSFTDMNVTGYFYCNFSSLNLSNIDFDRLPKFVNLENSVLSLCKFHAFEVYAYSEIGATTIQGISSIKNPTILHFSHAELTNITLNNLTSGMTLDITGCKSLDIDFLKLLPVNPTNMINPGAGKAEQAMSYIQNQPRNSGRFKIAIDHITLQSPAFIRFLAAAEYMLTQPHPFNADPINFLYIKLPHNIDNKKAFVLELDKYRDAEKIRAPEVQLANRSIRVMLLAAVIDKIEELAKSGVDIKPFYEAAMKHGCFSPFKKGGFFKGDLSDEQKVLKKVYEEMVAKQEKTEEKGLKR